MNNIATATASNLMLYTKNDILHVTEKIDNGLKKTWNEMNISEKLIYVITLGIYSPHLEPEQIEALKSHLAGFEPLKDPDNPKLIGRLSLMNGCTIECYRNAPDSDNALDSSLTLIIKQRIEKDGHPSPLSNQELQTTSEHKLNNEQSNTLIS